MRGWMLATLGCLTLLSAAFTSSCSSTPPDPCASVTIDDFKELIIVDESVFNDPRTSNANDGAWSFRHVVESLAPASTDPGELVRAWFTEWVATTTYNGYPLDPIDGYRQSAMTAKILCPWMQRTLGNNCNSDCSKCDSNPPKLDLAQAPFRPIAIVNRMELRNQPDLGKSGESRIIYELTDGAGDDANSSAMPMTLIFEYSLPDSKTTEEWAQAWHALGSFTAFDDTFKTALATFTESWIGKNASPNRQNGSALSQARTNEEVLNWDWQQRQFELGKDGGMHLAGLRDTPPGDLNNSQVIADYINQNSVAILSGAYAMPEAMLGGMSDFVRPQVWSFPGVSENLRHAWATNTCNGCHTQEQQSNDTAFHVSPFRIGVARLSPYVYDPSNRANDQLTVREQSMRDALCGK